MADQDTAPNTTPATEAVAEAAAAEDAAPAAGNKKKLLLLASGAVAVVGVAVAVGVIFLTGGGAAEDQAHGASVAPPTGAVYDVPEFTVNLLTDPAAGTRFLKIRLALELENAADTATLEPLLARLQDDWGTYLRQLRPQDLQGSAAQQRLRENLLRRARQTLEPLPLQAVYIRDMLVQ